MNPNWLNTASVKPVFSSLNKAEVGADGSTVFAPFLSLTNRDGASRTVELPESETALEPGGIWQVLVFNDPVNLMQYVVWVFQKVFGFDLAKARHHMLEVHEKGVSLLWEGEREQAEAYVHTLQGWHLRAVLERYDSDKV
jgi:ATP-dependent Clp protease adaptor protein ClpS